MKNFLRALSFLTIIPLPFTAYSADGKELSASAAAFPPAGAVLGLCLAAVAFLGRSALSPALIAVIVLALSFLLTRGLHLDGLADTADGLLGTTGLESAFRAMADSSIGVMGASAVFFVYLLKYTILSGFEYNLLIPALLIMPLAGRWAIVFSGTWFEPARGRGLGELFLQGLSPKVLLKASLGALAILAAVAWWQKQLLLPLAAGCFAALAAAFLLSVYASRRLGGLSGDILGACSELGELFFLAGYALSTGPGPAAMPVLLVVNLYALIW